MNKNSSTLIRIMTSALLTGAMFVGHVAKASSIDFPEPSENFVPKKTYAVSYDKLWDTAVGVLEKYRITALSADKLSGVIQTDYFGEQERMVWGGFGGLQNSRCKMNIIIRNQSDGSIKLNVVAKCESTSQGVYDNAGSSQWHDVSSQNEKLTQKLETMFYEQVENVLNLGGGSDKQVGLKSMAAASPVIHNDNSSYAEVLTNDSIVRLVKAGLSEEVVVSMVKTKPSRFDVSVDGLLTLKSNSVSDKVINEMILCGQAKYEIGTAPTASASESIKIPAKTPIKLHIDEELSSGTAKSGDAFKLLVAEDVVVGGHVLIAKGTVATGRVTAARKKIFAGMNGKLELAVDSVMAVDGQSIALEGRITEDGGEATFGQVGSEVTLARGRPINAIVDTEKEIKLNNASTEDYAKTATANNASSVEVPKASESQESQGVNETNTANSNSAAEIDRLCAQLLNPDKPREVESALKDLRELNAPQAVSKILPCLAYPDVHDVRDACRTLAVLGDKTIIPYIEPLLKDTRRGVAKDAQNAIDELQKK